MSLTGGKRAEEALRASEERWRDLVEGSIEGIMVHREFKLLFVNRALASIFGYDSPEEMLAMGELKKTLAPSDLPWLENRYRARMAGEEVPNRYEYRGLRKDGSTIWLENLARRVMWEGEPAVQATLQDISAPKEAEEALRESEERWRDLVEGSIEGIVVHRGFRLLFVNRAYASIFGYDSPEELLAMGDQKKLFAPQERSRVENSYFKRMAGGDPPPRFEFQGLRKDGSPIWLENLARRVMWEGEPAVQATVQEITARKEAEEAVRASEERFRDLIERAVEGVMIHRDFQLLFVNQAYAAIHGYESPEEILALGDARKFYAPEEIPRLEAINRDRMQSGDAPTQYEFKGLRKDGTKIWLRNLSRKITWRGQPAVQSTLLDITDRKQAEDELQASQRLLREVFNAIPHQLFLKDLKGRYQMVNRNFGDYWGIDPEHATDWSTKDLPVVDERLKEFFRDTDRKVLQTGLTVEADFSYKKKDGSETFRRQIKVPLRNQAGEIVGIIGLSEDVTERKQGELALQESESKYRTLIEQASDGIYLTDREGNYLDVNRRGCDLVGFSREELLLLNVRAFVPPEETANFEKRRSQIEVGESLLFEREIVRKDGSRFPAEISAKLLGDGRALAIVRDITERKQAELALRESESQTRLMIDNLPALITYMGSDQRYRYVNNTAVEWYGRPAADIVGRTVKEIIGPAYEKLEPRIVAALSGQKVTFEEEVSYPDGHSRYVQLTYVPILGEDGEVKGFFGLIVDLTDRIQAEEELQASQRLLQTVFDTIPHSVFARGKGGDFLMVNKAMAARNGLEPQDFLKKEIWEIAPELKKNRAEYLEWDRLVFETKKPLKGEEVSVVLPDGRERIQQATKAPLLDDVGRVVGVVGISEDITERKQAEEAVAKIGRIMAKSQQIAHVGSLEWEITSNRQFWSDEVFRILGYEPQSFEPDEKIFAGVLHPDDKKRVLVAMNEAVSPGRSFDLECKIVRPDGTQRLLHAQGEFTRDDRGNPLQMVGTVQDITERAQMEEQLRRAQRMEVIGTMAGGIAHDFNNLLYPIIGFTELVLEQTPEDSEARENLKIIRDTAHRAKELVAQILLFGKRSEGDRQTISLEAIIGDALNLFHSTLPRNVIIRQILWGEISPVSADATQIHQILMNLGLNAAQAMLDGGELTISLENVELEDFECYLGKISGSFVRLSVSDTGSGMDEAVQARIFEPFFSTKEPGKGSGLGLSSVFGIVRNHGGHLNVISRPGEGTTLEVYLPAIEKDVAPQPEPDTPAIPGKESILYVDDEQAITLLAKRALEKLGYRVTVLTDSLEALHQFETDPTRFDLVVTDQMMPGMTGVQLASEIRRCRPEIPIILCTGFSDFARPENADQFQINEIVYKPLGPRDLGKVVRRVLDGTPA